MKAFKQLAGVLLAIVGAFALGYIALNRGEQINALWIVVAAVCIYLVAYRYYGPVSYTHLTLPTTPY